jgi:hypothetical protein
MARAFNETHNLEWDAAHIDETAAFAVSLWYNRADTSSAGFALHFRDGNRGAAVRVSGGGVSLFTGNSATEWAADTTQEKNSATTTADVWTHLCGSISATPAVLSAYLSGAALTNSSATLINPGTDTDKIRVGNRTNGGAGFKGRLAEIAIWQGIELSAADALQLSKGVSPLLVRPSALVHYCPLIGRVDAEGCHISGKLATNTGSTQYAHPRISYFVPPQLLLYGPTAPPPPAPSLTDSLISYWKLDESSAGAGAVTRNDSHSTNHLTDNGTTPSAVGKIGNAAQFTAANSERLTIADNASLSVGDIDFTWAFWLYMDSTTGYQAYISKDSDDGSGGAFEIRKEEGETRPTWLIRQSGGSDCARVQWGGSALSTGTWYYVVCYHDAANNIAGIGVNDVFTTASTTGTPFDDPGKLAIGGSSAAAGYSSCRIDEVGFWKRMLTADERTQLYNGGAGLSYDDFVSSQSNPPRAMTHYRRRRSA